MLPGCAPLSNLSASVLVYAINEIVCMAMDAAELIAAILGACTHHDALCVGVDASPGDIRTAFRRRALKVHPDKCDDEHASIAFARLTDALENLQQQQPAPWRHRSQAAQGFKRKRRRTDSGTTRSWKEWERELDRREEQERCYHRLQSDRYAQRHAAGLLLKVCKVADELDERAGITENELLPRTDDDDECPGSLVGASGDTAADTERLLDLLTYVRERHLYCYFCCTGYGSEEGLRRDCPGMLEEDHEDGEEEGRGGDGVCDY